MARGKVVETDYYEFSKLLRRASDGGQRIDKTDPRWAEYVKTHGINEVAATAIARQRFENPVAVIIDEGQENDGLYFYSKDDEGCLKLQVIE